jgi:predicted nucleotide-binding protein
MKRDKELLRKILIEIENKGPNINSGELNIEGYDSEKIIEHLKLLYDDGFVEGIDVSNKDGKGWISMSLTWEGHDILEELKKNNRKKIPGQNISTKRNEVFIVHGHDEKLLNEIARFLQILEIIPIILFEKASRGKTIIEKLESHSSVSYAIVLFTPDDLGKCKKEESQLLPRARQNVVLELGYFLGKIGRENVTVLYDESVELPSDYRGVEYIKIDKEGAWKLKLLKELKASGFQIDMNKAI